MPCGNDSSEGWAHAGLRGDRDRSARFAGRIMEHGGRVKAGEGLALRKASSSPRRSSCDVARSAACEAGLLDGRQRQGRLLPRPRGDRDAAPPRRQGAFGTPAGVGHL